MRNSSCLALFLSAVVLGVDGGRVVPRLNPFVRPQMTRVLNKPAAMPVPGADVNSAAALTGSSLAHNAQAVPAGPSPFNIVEQRAGRVARRAEDKEEDDGGFMKFLKVEQDIQVTAEEYALALEQEIEAQRRKYYINGEVKPNNLVVPWRPVDENALKKEARRVLKKNGIADPDGPGELDNEDSPLGMTLVGEEDVNLDWSGGDPKEKIGYIIEKKPKSATNFREVATYENMETSYLLAKDYAGHEYKYTDEVVPGTWTYRLLCRMQSGETTVIDQQDIVVPELSGLDNKIGLALLIGTFAIIGIYFSCFDAAPEF